MPIKSRAHVGPKRQEKQIAAETGGKRVPLSGALKHQKGDVVLDDYLIDAKQTDRSFTMSETVLAKISLEAAQRKRRPALQVTLNSMPPGKRRWAVIPWDDFLAYLGGNDE